MPLWVQLAAILLLLAGIIAYASGEMTREAESKQLIENTRQQLGRQLALVRSSSSEVLAGKIPISDSESRRQQLATLLDKFAALMPDINHVRIVNSQGEQQAAWYRPGADTGDLINLSTEIRDGDLLLGELHAGWDARQAVLTVERDVTAVRRNVFFTLLLAIGVLSLWIRLQIDRPLKLIQRQLVARSSGEALSLPWWVASEFQQLKELETHFDEVGIFNDALAQEMERRKGAEVELTKLRDEAMEANHAKSLFLANMSHELRTPLNAIIGYSEILQEETRANEQQEYTDDLEKIHMAGRHLLELINEILDLSKIEAGKMELHLETFVVSDAIDAVVTTVRPMAAKNGNVVRVENSHTVSVMSGDLTKMRQILYNLLSNAIKFTEHGQVVVSSEPQRKHDIAGVEIKVIDSGIGMTPDEMQHLFIPFQQADASTTRKYGGTGLGLALCRRLCDMMQGQIHAESTVGEGSTFSVWLPLNVTNDKYPRPELARTSKTWPSQPGGHPDDSDQEERRQKITTVLNIGDDPVLLDLMARVYQREGFRSISAPGGKVGLDLARKLRPGLVTLDITMPEMDGWAVLSAFKSDDDLKNIPVLMVGTEDNKPRALNMGAMGAISKPIAWGHLLDLTRSAVRKSV
jgi:signal transduction histidine kinase/CheY-like chemotaxis protein